jgi:hypothetical protein
LFLETRTRMITIIIMNGKIGKLFFFTLLFSSCTCLWKHLSEHLFLYRVRCSNCQIWIQE